jgi:hypothetical protein
MNGRQPRAELASRHTIQTAVFSFIYWQSCNVSILNRIDNPLPCPAMRIVKIQCVERIMETPEEPLCGRAKLVTWWHPSLRIRLVRLIPDDKLLDASLFAPLATLLSIVMEFCNGLTPGTETLASCKN